jgi:hypothetical protein
MSVGQSNLKEATKYSQYYKYKVIVENHAYPNKKDYAFKLDNNILKKLFNKPSKRFSMNQSRVGFQTIIFRYKPKESRKIINDSYVQFEPFDIKVSTQDCHDLVYYHIPNNGKNCEILKTIHILNVDKVVKKLEDILEDTYISDNGKYNMINSLKKHLGNIQSPNRYVSEDYEEFAGLKEDHAIMILDDYDDDELLDTLVEYLF